MAEIFLRLGCALVAWLLVFAYGILLWVVSLADCSLELWRTTLLFAALATGAAALLPLGLPWRSSLRWVALPVLPLLGAGVLQAVRLWDAVGGAALCEVLAGSPAPGAGETWERFWAPIQLAVCLACAAQIVRFWLPERSSDASEHLPQ